MAQAYSESASSDDEDAEPHLSSTRKRKRTPSAENVTGDVPHRAESAEILTEDTIDEFFFTAVDKMPRDLVPEDALDGPVELLPDDAVEQRLGSASRSVLQRIAKDRQHGQERFEEVGVGFEPNAPPQSRRHLQLLSMLPCGFAWEPASPQRGAAVILPQGA